MTQWLIALCALGMMIFSAQEGYAMRCEIKPAKELFESHDVVFIGQLERYQPWQNSTEHEPALEMWDLRVMKIWKGLDDNPVHVMATHEFSRSFKQDSLKKWHKMEAPKTYILFAHRVPSGNPTGLELLINKCGFWEPQQYEAELDALINKSDDPFSGNLNK